MADSKPVIVEYRSSLLPAAIRIYSFTTLAFFFAALSILAWLIPLGVPRWLRQVNVQLDYFQARALEHLLYLFYGLGYFCSVLGLIFSVLAILQTTRRRFATVALLANVAMIVVWCLIVFRA